MEPELIETYFPLWFSLSALWVAGWVLASIIHRRAHGRPILFRTVPNAEFVESAASGHSHRTWYTKLGGASRCLVVAINRGQLIIRPQFPFNLMFLPEVYGLEHDVPVDRVSNVEIKPGRFRTGVDVQFRSTESTNEHVTLYLRRPEDFVRILKERAQASAPRRHGA